MIRGGVIILILLCALNASAQIFETVMDKFEDNKNNWPVFKNDSVSAQLIDNKYVISNKTVNSQKFFSSYIINPHYDYTIEMKFRQPSKDKNTSVGFIWGNYIDTDNLTFLFSYKKKFKIEGKQNNKYFISKNWKHSGKIRKKGSVNTLKIRKSGRTIKYYINDRRVYTSENYPIVGTEYGFILNGQTSLEVDYIKISALKTDMYLVDNPVQGNKLQNLGSKVNSNFSERGPVISPDGKTLFITRTHPENVNGLQTDDIWYSTLDGYGEWNELEHAGFPLNNEGNNFVISVTPDGNTLLVGNTYKRDGSPDKSGISVASKRNGEWLVPVKQNIRNYENIDGYGSFFLTADGTKLIICAENEESQGDLDLYVSFLRKPGKWSQPLNMGPVINTFASDFAPFLAVDGKTLYFSSYGHKGYGKSDIFVSKRLDDTWLNWSQPKNLGPEINTSGWEAYYCTTAKGDYAYVVSSRRDISFGMEDIFRIGVAESAKPDPVVLVSGFAYNKKTNEKIEAEIKYENLSTGEEEGIAYSTINDGYKLVFPKGDSYGFRAVSDGFYAVSQNIDLSDLEDFEEKQVDLYLVPIERGQAIRLNNIFFDFDKATLQTRSFAELNRLVTVLNENPKIEIAIAGHTDDKGSDEYNLNLSENRANSVMNYLIEHGIPANRISARGYGESVPIATNETEEGRQLNRRVEFVIL